MISRVYLSLCAVLVLAATCVSCSKTDSEQTGKRAIIAPSKQLFPGRQGSSWFYTGPNPGGSAVILVCVLVAEDNVSRLLSEMDEGYFADKNLAELSEHVAGYSSKRNKLSLLCWEITTTRKVAYTQSFSQLYRLYYGGRPTSTRICSAEVGDEPQFAPIESKQFKAQTSQANHKVMNRVHYPFVNITKKGHRALTPKELQLQSGRYMITDEYDGPVFTRAFSRGIGLVALFEDVEPSDKQVPRADKKRYKNSYYPKKSLVHRLAYYRIVSADGKVIEFPRLDDQSGTNPPPE